MWDWSARLVIAAVTTAALFALSDAQTAGASQLFSVTSEIQEVNPLTPGANGQVTRMVTVPAGHHLPAKETINIEADWDFAPGGAVPIDDKVGTVILSVDQTPCDGAAEFFVADILNKAPATDEKARWKAIVTGSLVFDFVITGDATTGHTMKANLFLVSNFCSPLSLTIVHQGLSFPAGATVIVSPSLEGFYNWDASYSSAPLMLPPEHTAMDSDTVAIGVDTDGDQVPDFTDNCPTVANGPNEQFVIGVGNQRDTDGDTLGDACDPDDDGDGFCDPGESDPSCTGSDEGFFVFDPVSPPSGPPINCRASPEDFDGFKDSDGCPEPDNDNDTLPDSSDVCPGTDADAGPDGMLGSSEDVNHNGILDPGEDIVVVDGVLTTDDSVLTFEDFDGVLDGDGCYDAPGGDFDGDGWTDDVEVLFLGTDASIFCGVNGWPPDPLPAGGNQVVQVDDIFFATSRFGLTSSDPGYVAQAEISSQNGVIAVDDIFGFTSRAGLSC